LYSIIEAFLRSFNLINKIVNISVVSNIISIVILVPLIYFLKFYGVSIYLLIFGLLPFILLFFIAKKFTQNISQNKNYILTKDDKQLIFKVGSISLLSSLLHQGVIIFIRKLLITNYGYEENGIYQSVLSISLSYFGLLYIFLTNYTLPKLSRCESNQSISDELNINARFLLLIIIPMMLLFYGFKDFGILLLFSKNFLNARELYFPQFIGDIFRVGAALFGLWLIPKRRIKHIIIIDTIFNIVLFILSYLFINVFVLPLIFVSYAYMLAFMSHFLMYFIYTKITIRFKVDKNVLLTFAYSMIAFILTYLITKQFKEYSILFVFMIIVIWFLLVVKVEEIKKMKYHVLSIIEDRRNKI